MSDRPRLVVLRALNLGDLLTGVPALRALRDAFPAHHRVLVAPAAFSTLMLREGLADEVADSHELAPLDERLARPDVAVDLHGRGPGSQPLLLALAPVRLICFEHPDVPATAGQPRWRAGEHEVHRWCRLLSESGVPADPSRLDLSVPDLDPPEAARQATVVHPGAAARARRWPAERFAAVAASEIAAGRRVVVTGSASERPLARRVADLAGLDASAVLAGRTDLDGMLALLSVAGRLVSGDTGVAHMAFALGTPSVTLYGPVAPSEWGPPPDRRHHVTLWAGRHGDPHADRLDPGLDALTVDDVISRLGALSPRRSTEPETVPR